MDASQIFKMMAEFMTENTSKEFPGSYGIRPGVSSVK